MFRTERFKADASAESVNHGAQSKETPLSSSQRGSILIGLIITMVVMAFLGAGMLSLTTTSTFHGLLFGKNAGASLAAESGGRYALAVIRDAYATDMTKLNAINADQTFNMSSGSSFQITNWVKTGTYPSPDTITFTSVGTVSAGFLEAKRQIKYGIQPANQSAAPPPQVLPPPVSDFNVPNANALRPYFSPVETADVLISQSVQKVDGDEALNLNAYIYTMGLRWYANTSMAQLDAIRKGNGGLLSYGVQVKIKALDQNSSNYNMFGISFRLDDSNDRTLTSVFDNMYGISFVKMPATKPNPAVPSEWNKAPEWYQNIIYYTPAWDVFSQGTGAGKWFVVLWKRVGGAGGSHTPLAYKKLTSADVTACSSGDANSCSEIKPWSTLIINVEEKMPGGDSTRYNVINSYLPAYTRFTGDVPQTPLWGNTNPIIWDSGADGNIVEDNSLTSLTTSNYGDGVTTGYIIGDTAQIKAREIGLHIYYNSPSAQNVFYDNFYINLLPSWTGGADGSGSVIQYP